MYQHKENLFGNKSKNIEHLEEELLKVKDGVLNDEIKRILINSINLCDYYLVLLNVNDNLEEKDSIKKFKKDYLMVFTTYEKLEGHNATFYSLSLEDILDMVVLTDSINGLIINTFDDKVIILKHDAEDLLMDSLDVNDKSNKCITFSLFEEKYKECVVKYCFKDKKEVGNPNVFVSSIGKASIKRYEKPLHNYIINIKNVLKTKEEFFDTFYNVFELARLNNISKVYIPEISEDVEVMESIIESAIKWQRINSYNLEIVFEFKDAKLVNEYQNMYFKLEKTKNLGTKDNDDADVYKAIELATKKHANVTRKGKNVPYIVHPIQVLDILSNHKASNSLKIAGVLHDTVEDTGLNILKIYKEFGEVVASLVAYHTENKARCYYIRKRHTFKSILRGTEEDVMLIAADTLANLKDMARDYKEVGDDLFSRFNASKDTIAFVYSSKIDAFEERLEDCKNLRDIYYEMNSLFKDVFVNYFADIDNHILYQVQGDNCSKFEKTKKKWEKCKKPILSNLLTVDHDHAEYIDDYWTYLDVKENIDKDLNSNFSIKLEKEIDAKDDVIDKKLVYKDGELKYYIHFSFGMPNMDYMLSHEFTKSDIKKLFINLRANYRCYDKRIRTIIKENIRGFNTFESFLDFIGVSHEHEYGGWFSEPK